MFTTALHTLVTRVARYFDAVYADFNRVIESDRELTCKRDPAVHYCDATPVDSSSVATQFVARDAQIETVPAIDAGTPAAACDACSLSRLDNFTRYMYPADRALFTATDYSKDELATGFNVRVEYDDSGRAIEARFETRDAANAFAREYLLVQNDTIVHYATVIAVGTNDSSTRHEFSSRATGSDAVESDSPGSYFVELLLNDPDLTDEAFVREQIAHEVAEYEEQMIASAEREYSANEVDLLTADASELDAEARALLDIRFPARYAETHTDNPVRTAAQFFSDDSDFEYHI